MSRPCFIVIDQGTSATKGFLFDEALTALATKKIQHTVDRPKRGWVECDGAEIVSACETVIGRMAEEARSRSLTAVAVGMAFQRSTFLFWRKSDGFFRHAYTANVAMMSAGFLLFGYQLTGYFVA